MTTFKRRTVIRGAGGTLALGLLAGCIGDDDDEPADDDDDDDEMTVDEWLADVANYDDIEDFTGQTEVTVQNGAVEDAPQTNVFEPPAIEIDTGTTVIWEWVDEANHSVTHENGDAFDSGVQDSGPFEHTFDEAGTYLYYCQPHRAQEQKGAVVVE